MSTAYISEADLTARFGTEVTALGEAVGVSAVAQAITDASEEAASYVNVQYTTALPNVPAPLKGATCDIARYRLYKDRAPEEVKYRYEQALKWLILLSQNKARLVFDPALTPEQVEVVVGPPAAPVVGQDTGGLFSEARMSQMPSNDLGLQGVQVGYNTDPFRRL